MIPVLTPLLLVLGPIALLVAMGIVFAETGLLIGFFLPGDSLLFTLGVLNAGGALHLPFWLIAVGLLLAAMAGDQVGYLLGRRFGRRVFNSNESRFFSRAQAERAQAFFAKHGPKAVVLARFVPVVRTFTPVVAGVARMPRRTFTAYNVAGAVAWTTGLLTVGFYLGGVPIIAAHVELFAIGMVALSTRWVPSPSMRSVSSTPGRGRDRSLRAHPSRPWTSYSPPSDPPARGCSSSSRTPPYPGYERTVAHALAQHHFLGSGRVYVHSLDSASLAAFHQAAPSVPLGLISEDGTGTVPTGQDTWLRTVNPATGSITDTSVDGAQARHLKVFAWPLDPSQSSAAEVERLVDDGVDGIITDNPILVCHEIAAAGASTT